MKKIFSKNKSKAATIISVCIAAIFLFSVIFLLTGSRNSTQASPPIIIDISFEGEYKIGDGEWHTIVQGEHIPSTRGDVTLRGLFQMYNPEDGEPLGPLFSESLVHLYFNHIGGYAILPGNETVPFEAEHKYFGENNCASMWCAVYSTGNEPITFVLQNPHSFGNENAIDEFLEYMSAAEGTYLESEMMEKGDPQRHVGLIILITSFIILGIAAFSTFIHIKKDKEMWIIGLMSLFAGGYLLFDAFAVSIWNKSYITNTRALGLCMMFYMLFGTMLIVSLLKGRIKAVGFTATLSSGAVILGCILLSFFGVVNFYDTWLYWAIVEIAVAVVLAICLCLSFRNGNPSEKKLYAVGLLFLAAFPIDVISTKFGWWTGGLVTKFVFFAVFVMALVVVLLVIPSHINAVTRAKELEAEQQLLKQELQENRISIMLSQMKPHFIFNTLNTIYHLCNIDPEKARSTISSFSTYLRNNINNLEQSDMIFFEKELSFINAYLDIEKVRFDDELLITYDIGVSNFKLPVLTVQPIVENAVKHGTSKKEGVSCLYITTRETDSFFEIEIRDTGVGFDSSYTPNDGNKHVGISSVRQRLETLCHGTLTIESTPGVGTTALIKIPKTEAYSK